MTFNPYADDDGVKIVILHRRWVNPSPECGTTPEQVQTWEDQHAAEWFAINLYCYDHGAQVFKVGWRNPFHGTLPQMHAEFDSARAGSMFLKRSEFEGELQHAAEVIAEAFTAAWNGWDEEAAND